MYQIGIGTGMGNPHGFAVRVPPGYGYGYSHSAPVPLPGPRGMGMGNPWRLPTDPCSHPSLVYVHHQDHFGISAHHPVVSARPTSDRAHDIYV